MKKKNKLQQLKPLLLIIFYIATASVLLHYKNWIWNGFMLDFMGLFYIVFSFFKMLDLRGFSESFRIYDPLAKRVPAYGKVYPFIETVLGIMFLMRYEINMALIITLIVLSITTIGVTKVLLDKKINTMCLFRYCPKATYDRSYIYRKCYYDYHGSFDASKLNNQTKGSAWGYFS
jgi:hypothetical protein